HRVEPARRALRNARALHAGHQPARLLRDGVRVVDGVALVRGDQRTRVPSVDARARDRVHHLRRDDRRRRSQRPVRDRGQLRHARDDRRRPGDHRCRGVGSEGLLMADILNPTWDKSAGFVRRPLDGKPYRILYAYNTREAYWTIGLSLDDGTPLLQGVAL